MENLKELEEIARQLRNKKARQWRANNKDKVRETNKRYWLKKAKEELERRKKCREHTKI